MLVMLPLFLCFLWCATCEGAAPIRYFFFDRDEALSDFAAEANNQFSLELMKALMTTSGNSHENVFFSPYSISAALAMTSLGAKGNTLREIDDTLHFSEINNNGVHEAYRALNEKYNIRNDDYILATANRLFATNRFRMNQTFQANVEKFYKEDLRKLNSKPDAEVNEWVKYRTGGRIKHFLNSRGRSTLDEGAGLTMANAPVFKGVWEIPFDNRLTKKRPFHVRNGVEKNVEMMQMVRHFQSVEDKELKIRMLRLPYKGDQLSMIVILPDNTEGLPEIVQKLTHHILTSLIGRSQRREVLIQFPKFRLQTSSNLKAILKQQGIEDLFTRAADLTGLSRNSVKVDAVVHDAFVEVNEKGTEAAAATAVQFGDHSSGQVEEPTTAFPATRPFYFAIVDNQQFNILFNGVFYGPQG